MTASMVESGAHVAPEQADARPSLLSIGFSALIAVYVTWQAVGAWVDLYAFYDLQLGGNEGPVLRALGAGAKAWAFVSTVFAGYLLVSLYGDVWRRIEARR